MAVVFAENPNGTAQADPVNGASGFTGILVGSWLTIELDAWENLCPTYYNSLH